MLLSGTSVTLGIRILSISDLCLSSIIKTVLLSLFKPLFSAQIRLFMSFKPKKSINSWLESLAQNRISFVFRSPGVLSI